MAQTFRDFAMECYLYPHSKEHYDLMKECSELALMTQCMVNHKFLMENASIFTDNGINLSEGYFQEGADGSTVAALADSVKKKAQNIVNKIWNGLKKFWERICNFFTKLRNTFDADGKTALKTLDTLRSMTITSNDIVGILGIIEENDTDTKMKLKWRWEIEQPFTKELNLKYAENTHKEDIVLFENAISTVLTTTSVVITPNVFNHHRKNTDGIINAKTLIKACKQLLNARSKIDLDKVTSLIDDEAENAAKHGLNLNVNTNDLNDQVKQMKAILDEIIKKAEETAKVSSEEIEGLGTVDHHAFNEGYSKIITSMNGVIRVYSAYLNYRSMSIHQINAWLTAHNQTAANK